MIKYNLIPRKNPVTKQVAYHANAIPVTPIKLDEIADEVSSMCTVTAHDIKAVLSVLETVVFKHLRNGNSVRLGDLGSFHARISSKGSATAEDFTAEKIRGIRVRFSPSAKMRYELAMKNPHVVLSKQKSPDEEEWVEL